MVNELQLGRNRRPWLRCQPKPLPESPSQQLASQPTGAPAQDTDPTPTINELLGGRVQAARGQAPGFGIFGPGSVSRHPKHGHRQYQPVAGYPVWVGPLGVLPLPAHSLQGPESQFNPDPQPIPGYAQVLWRQVGQYQPGLGLILSPYHQQCSGTAQCGPAESGAPAHPGVAWPRNQLSGRLPSSA